MAILCFNKTVACGTIASAALVYCIIILHNRKEKKETDKADHNKVCEIKIINTSSSNIHNERQIFAKNSANPNNIPVVSKVRQVVSSLPNLNTSNPIKPPRSKRLYQIQSKAVEDCNLIMQNSARSFAHNESSDTIILNNSPSSFEHGFNNVKDNLDRSIVICINNSIDSTNNKVQIKVSNSPVKLSTLNMKTVYASDDSCTKNRSVNLVKINQKNESKEKNIRMPSFNRRRLVEYFMSFRGNRLTNARNNKCTKEIEGNNITIIVNTSM